MNATITLNLTAADLELINKALDAYDAATHQEDARRADLGILLTKAALSPAALAIAEAWFAGEMDDWAVDTATKNDEPGAVEAQKALGNFI